MLFSHHGFIFMLYTEHATFFCPLASQAVVIKIIYKH